MPCMTAMHRTQFMPSPPMRIYPSLHIHIGRVVVPSLNSGLALPDGLLPPSVGGIWGPFSLTTTVAAAAPKLSSLRHLLSADQPGGESTPTMLALSRGVLRVGEGSSGQGGPSLWGEEEVPEPQGEGGAGASSGRRTAGRGRGGRGRGIKAEAGADGGRGGGRGRGRGGRGRGRGPAEEAEKPQPSRPALPSSPAGGVGGVFKQRTLLSLWPQGAPPNSSPAQRHALSLTPTKRHRAPDPDLDLEADPGGEEDGEAGGTPSRGGGSLDAIGTTPPRRPGRPTYGSAMGSLAAAGVPSLRPRLSRDGDEGDDDDAALAHHLEGEDDGSEGERQDPSWGVAAAAATAGKGNGVCQPGKRGKRKPAAPQRTAVLQLRRAALLQRGGSAAAVHRGDPAVQQRGDPAVRQYVKDEEEEAGGAHGGWRGDDEDEEEAAAGALGSGSQGSLALGGGGEGLQRKLGMAGHVARIRLENFMCHEHFELSFG